MTKGKFIVLEGLDFSGKTTLATMLVKHLNDNGIKTIHASCSDKNNRLARVVKEHVLNGEQLPSVDTQAMLYAACINDLVDTVLLPSLNEGSWVVCERYTLSNRVYQKHSLLTNALTGSIERRLLPDLTIVLDITPQVHMERSKARGDVMDAMENVDEVTITQRRKQYRLQVRQCSKTHLLDSTMNPRDLLNATMDIISANLM